MERLNIMPEGTKIPADIAEKAKHLAEQLEHYKLNREVLDKLDPIKKGTPNVMSGFVELMEDFIVLRTNYQYAPNYDEVFGPLCKNIADYHPEKAK